jgi:hypothetical protein
MVFSSTAKLDNHIKYSSVHAAAVKKLNEPPQPVEEIIVPEEPTSQEPSMKCRAIYSGTKFFWKTQENIDVNIYLHVDPMIVEVIPHHGRANTELPRLYLSETAIIDYVGPDTITAKVNAIKKDAGNQRFKEALPPDSELFTEQRRLAVVSHVMSSLHIKNTSVNSNRSIVVYEPSPPPDGRPVDSSAVILNSKPNGLIPVHVAYRRHSSDQEIEATMGEIENLQQNIRDLTSKASVMALLVSLGVGILNNGILRRQARLTQGTIAQQRWRWAIDRVLLINRVRKTREYLEIISWGRK